MPQPWKFKAFAKKWRARCKKVCDWITHKISTYSCCSFYVNTQLILSKSTTTRLVVVVVWPVQFARDCWSPWLKCTKLQPFFFSACKRCYNLLQSASRLSFYARMFLLQSGCCFFSQLLCDNLVHLDGWTEQTMTRLLSPVADDEVRDKLRSIAGP